MTLFTARPPLEAYGLASTVAEFCDSKSGLTDARATIVASLSRAEDHDIARIACQTRARDAQGIGEDHKGQAGCLDRSRPGCYLSSHPPTAQSARTGTTSGFAFPKEEDPDGCIRKLR